MKKFFWVLLFGFLLGTTLAGLFTPRMISWYFDPPTAIGVSCKEAVVWGINAYQKMLMVGGGVGLVLAAMFAATRAMSKGPSDKGQGKKTTAEDKSISTTKEPQL